MRSAPLLLLIVATIALPTLADAQKSIGTTVSIPVNFRGAWAPNAQACSRGRDQLTVVERGGLEITANAINSYETSFRPVRMLPSASGSFVFRATPFSEGEAGSPAVVTLRMAGQQLSLNATGGGQINRAYVRCGTTIAALPAPKLDALPRTGRCRLRVGNRAVIQGPCTFNLDKGGDFQIMSQKRDYFAYVAVSGSSAEGYWNGVAGASHAQTSLGILRRSGGCWTSAAAEVCAWSH